MSQLELFLPLYCASLDASSLDEAWRITMENLTQLDSTLGYEYQFIEKEFGLAEYELPRFTSKQWEQYYKKREENCEKGRVHIVPLDPIRIFGQDSGKEWVLIGSSKGDTESIEAFNEIDLRVMRAASFESLAVHLFKFMDTEKAPQSQDSFTTNLRKWFAETGLTAKDMGKFSVSQFNNNVNCNQCSLWVKKLSHIIPRTQSQINAEWEAARHAEFDASAREPPAAEIPFVFMADTKDLPDLIGCKADSSGEELAAAFHRFIYQRISSIVPNRESIRIVSVKRNRTNATLCRLYVDGYNNKTDNRPLENLLDDPRRFLFGFGYM